MGNAPSNQLHCEEKRTNRNPPLSPAREAEKPSLSPASKPGRLHRPLGSKKGSLDLPDISLDARAAAPVPIPSRSDKQKLKRQQMETWQTPHSYVQPPVPPPSVDNVGPSIAALGEDFTPKDRDGSSYFEPQVVRSELPIPFGRSGMDTSRDASEETIETPIVWKGTGASSVVVVHTINDTDIHTTLDVDGGRFTTTLPLPPGTHQIKFYVDGAPSLSDDFSKTVDGSSTLVNYITVGFGNTGGPSMDPIPLPRTHSFFDSEPFIPQSFDPYSDHGWCTEIPSELIEAAATEDEFITAFNDARNAAGADRFQPVLHQGPEMPPAPALPRHLEKQILNTVIGSPSGKDKRRGRGQRSRANSMSKSPDESPRLPVTSASGTEVNNPPGGAGMTPAINIPGAQSELPVSKIPPPNLTDYETIIGDDDMSILPLPSHVVLNHLSTSSIRNGVIAVADTVRYKNKFLTTIYYKPT